MTKPFQLDKRLANDTHLLLDLENFMIFLHKNATIPWIIVVPKTDVIEVYDLPNDVQQSLNVLIKRIAVYIKKEFSTEKTNTAAIGNIVSQLHIHVIGRKTGDACWPDVVWGNEYTFVEYNQKQLTHIKNSFLTLFNPSPN